MDKCEYCGQETKLSGLRYVKLNEGETLPHQAEGHVDGRGYLCSSCRSFRKIVRS